jgi:hypothetical protein
MEHSGSTKEKEAYNIPYRMDLIEKYLVERLKEHEETSQSLLKSIFRSEITWIVTIAGAVFSFVTMVVLPLQKLQIQVSQIQKQLIGLDETNLKIGDRLNMLEKRQEVVYSTLKLK